MMPRIIWIARTARAYILHPVTLLVLATVVIAEMARAASALSICVPLLWIGLLAGYFVDRRRLRLRGDGAELRAAEQGALRRVASAVLAGEPACRVHAIAARELATLLDAEFAAILQFGEDGDAEVVGAWALPSVRTLPVGTVLAVHPSSPLARVAASGHPALEPDAPPSVLQDAEGGAAGVAAPILLDGRAWGAITAGSRLAGSFDPARARRLETFCTFLASAVASLADRAQLAADALTDPLTGLANGRALHQRLAAEASAAARHGRPLSVAMIDLDNFKEVNDTLGHAAGDAVLRRVAAALRALARTEDTVGRLGGDEFLWILPDTVGEDAVIALERARALVAETLDTPVAVTVSAGVCDTHTTSEPVELLQGADQALYRSKADGRDRVGVQRPHTVGQDTAEGREEWVARTHALSGLRALARSVDARDVATREHSRRVAWFAGRLAEASGWSPERVTLLREAALVHDVGKLGVPDALLVKPGPLTNRERRQMSEHPELSARIVGGVLTPEQAEWIRNHHERPDGTGYPRGIDAGGISDGAGFIALAEAWDTMMSGRSYSARKTTTEALSECGELAGAQFTEPAIDALRTLAEAGGLGETAAPPLLVAGARPA